MSDPELKVRITAELNQIKQSLAALNNDFVKVGNSGKKAGTEAAGGFEKIESAAKKAAIAVGAFFGIQAGVALTKQIAAINSEYIAMSSRLKIAVGDTGDLAKTQQELFEISQKTSTELGSTVDLYTNVARSTKNLSGVTDEMRMRLTDVLGKYTAISGGGEAANQALRQLGQAMSSNFAAAAQELNSMTDALPAMSSALVEAFGLSGTKELKTFAEEGKLTTETFVAAMIRMGDKADAEFGGMADTVGKAMQRLKNEVTQAIGTADLSNLTGAIDDFTKKAADPNTVQAIQSLAGALTTFAGVLLDITVGAIEATQEIGVLFAKMAGAKDPIGDLERQIKSVERALQGDVFHEGAARHWFDSKEELEAKKKQLQELLDVTMGLKKGTTAGQAGGSAGEEAAKTEQIRLQALELEKQAALKAQQKIAEEEAAKAAKDRQKSVDAMLASLEESAATEGRSTEETLRYKLATLNATQEEIKRAVELSATAEAMKAKGEAEKEAAEAVKTAAEAEKREREKRQKDNEKNFSDAQQRLAVIEGRHLDARLAAIDEKYKTQLESMVLEGDKAGEDLIKALLDEEKAQAQFDIIKDKFDKVLEEIATKEESLANRVRIGDISQATADSDLDAFRTGKRGEAQGLLGELQGAARTDEQKEGVEQSTEKLNATKEAATGAALAIQQLEGNLKSMKEGLIAAFAGAAVDGLTQALVDIAEGTKTAKEAIVDFFRDLAQQMLTMVARIVATMAVLAGISAVTGIPVSALAQFAGMSGSVKHSGGIVGQGGTIRSGLDPLMFAMAPRYHAGGVAGLKPGEVPAVLQKGEEVLTRNDPRHQANGGASGGSGGAGGTRVINVVDPNMVADYMATPAGEKVMVNLIQRNAGSIKQVMT